MIIWSEVQILTLFSLYCQSSVIILKVEVLSFMSNNWSVESQPSASRGGFRRKLLFGVCGVVLLGALSYGGYRLLSKPVPVEDAPVAVTVENTYLKEYREFDTIKSLVEPYENYYIGYLLGLEDYVSAPQPRGIYTGMGELAELYRGKESSHTGEPWDDSLFLSSVATVNYYYDASSRLLTQVIMVGESGSSKQTGWHIVYDQAGGVQDYFRVSSGVSPF